MEPQPVIDFINLGIALTNLQWPTQVKKVEKLWEHVRPLLISLMEVRFLQEREELAALIRRIREVAQGNADFDWQVDSQGQYWHEFTELMKRVWHRTSGELSSRRVLLLDQNAVTISLRELQETITGEEKKIILADTLRCLETGAYRAAIVMGWNLAYEHLRRWVFKSKRKRLKEFNNVLTQKYRTKTDQYDPVKIYEDFHDLRERQVVDFAYEAKLFEKQKHQVLQNALTARNHFAHPSSRRATAASATGYIEDLVINILNDPHFAYKD